MSGYLADTVWLQTSVAVPAVVIATMTAVPRTPQIGVATMIPATAATTRTVIVAVIMVATATIATMVVVTTVMTMATAVASTATLLAGKIVTAGKTAGTVVVATMIVMLTHPATTRAPPLLVTHMPVAPMSLVTMTDMPGRFMTAQIGHPVGSGSFAFLLFSPVFSRCSICVCNGFNARPRHGNEFDGATVGRQCLFIQNESLQKSAGLERQLSCDHSSTVRKVCRRFARRSLDDILVFYLFARIVGNLAAGR